jgi:hypothetical protein
MSVERFDAGGNPFQLPSTNPGLARLSKSYCFVTSPAGTVFSSPPDNLTTTLPDFSSTLTTVASLDDPLDLTFT